jgi:hypothetical protein
LAQFILKSLDLEKPEHSKNSRESKRTIGWPMVNPLINEIINELTNELINSLMN